MKKLASSILLLCFILSCVATSALSENKLNLINVDLLWAGPYAALDSFARAYPDVEINHVEMNDEQLSASIMSQQADMDIIALDYEQYVTFAQKNALVDLYQFSDLTDHLKYWMPGVLDLLEIDGKLCALPNYILSEAFTLNDTVYRASGFDWPNNINYSWDELADLAENAQLGQYGNPPLLADFLSFPWPMWQYVSLQAQQSEQINFDTSLFRKTMEAYKRLVSLGAVVEHDESSMEGAIA